MLDSLPIPVLGRFEQELYKFVEAKHPTVLTDIVEKKALDDDLKAKLKKAIEAFKKKFVLDPSKAGAAAAADDEDEAPAEEAEEAPKAKKAKKSKKGE
jgi:F-type H+-transporting ATPase subunit alpha